MTPQKRWYVVAIIAFFFVLCWFFVIRLGMGQSFAPAPKKSRFEARIPFHRDECVEVMTNRGKIVFVEENAYNQEEFVNEINRVVISRKNIKAVVLIIGVDGDIGFESMTRAIGLSVSKPIKLYYFHESSSRHLEYED